MRLATCAAVAQSATVAATGTVTQVVAVIATVTARAQSAVVVLRGALVHNATLIAVSQVAYVRIFRDVRVSQFSPELIARSGPEDV